MSNLKSVIAGLLIGTSIGYGINKIKQPTYTISEKNNTTYMKARNVKQNYQIYEVQDNFYLGNLKHNLNGVKELSYQQGLKEQNKEAPYIRRDELEKIIQEKYEEIRRKIR